MGLFVTCHYKKILIFFLFLCCYSISAFESGGIASGTGFYISNEGYILSAYHVIKNHDEVWVRSSDDKKWRHTEIVKVDAVLDLALLRTKKNSQFLKITNWESVPIGLEVCSIGYPMLGFQGTAIRITQGIINSDEGASGQKKLFQLSAEVEKGNSGGPVIAPDGSVVGIILSKLDALSVAEKIQDLPQNVNFALKTRPLLKFLEDTPVNLKINDLNLSTRLKPYEILKNTEPAIVRILSISKEEAMKHLDLVE
ncbi:MAG: serine protease [Chlamydiia bacterium]|nr:serine protease [Chlamydiia bacterium]